MSNQDDHPHVTQDPAFLSTPARRRYRPSSPYDVDDGLEAQFNFEPSRQLTLLDIDVRNGVRSYPQPTMELGAAAINVAEMTLEQRSVFSHHQINSNTPHFFCFSIVEFGTKGFDW